MIQIDGQSSIVAIADSSEKVLWSGVAVHGGTRQCALCKVTSDESVVGDMMKRSTYERYSTAGKFTAAIETEKYHRRTQRTAGGLPDEQNQVQ